MSGQKLRNKARVLLFIGERWSAFFLMLMLVVFGNRHIGTIVVLSIVGALVYNHVFIGLMGLHDPPGLYFDLNRFLENPSWHELTRKLPF